MQRALPLDSCSAVRSTTQVTSSPTSMTRKLSRVTTICAGWVYSEAAARIGSASSLK